MTRKRFVKLLMADGRTRNEAAFCALLARGYGYGYDDSYELIDHYGTLYSPDQIEQAVRRIAEAISAVLPQIVESCNNIAKRLSEIAESALTLRQNNDE